MITRDELTAITSTLQRCPLTPAEVIGINGIIRKLDLAVTAAEQQQAQQASEIEADTEASTE